MEFFGDFLSFFRARTSHSKPAVIWNVDPISPNGFQLTIVTDLKCLFDYLNDRWRHVRLRNRVLCNGKSHKKLSYWGAIFWKRVASGNDQNTMELSPGNFYMRWAWRFDYFQPPWNSREDLSWKFRIFARFFWIFGLTIFHWSKL